MLEPTTARTAAEEEERSSRQSRRGKLRYGGEKGRKEKNQAWISPIMAGEDFCCGFHIGFLGRCSVRGESPAMAVGGNDRGSKERHSFQPPQPKRAPIQEIIQNLQYYNSDLHSDNLSEL